MNEISVISSCAGATRTSAFASNRLMDAVARLPTKQRAALILRTYQELSHQEIAKLLGTTVGAAKANVFHALQNLRKLLGEMP